MSTNQLLQAGFLAVLTATGLLAAATSFEPARPGWLPRFGWILLRYVLPLVALVAVVSWCLLRR